MVRYLSPGLGRRFSYRSFGTFPLMAFRSGVGRMIAHPVWRWEGAGGAVVAEARLDARAASGLPSFVEVDRNALCVPTCLDPTRFAKALVRPLRSTAKNVTPRSELAARHEGARLRIDLPFGWELRRSDEDRALEWLAEESSGQVSVTRAELANLSGGEDTWQALARSDLHGVWDRASALQNKPGVGFLFYCLAWLHVEDAERLEVSDVPEISLLSPRGRYTRRYIVPWTTTKEHEETFALRIEDVSEALEGEDLEAARGHWREVCAHANALARPSADAHTWRLSARIQRASGDRAKARADLLWAERQARSAELDLQPLAAEWERLELPRPEAWRDGG